MSRRSRARAENRHHRRWGLAPRPENAPTIRAAGRFGNPRTRPGHRPVEKPTRRASRVRGREAWRVGDRVPAWSRHRPGASRRRPCCRVTGCRKTALPAFGTSVAVVRPPTVIERRFPRVWSGQDIPGGRSQPPAGTSGNGPHIDGEPAQDGRVQDAIPAAAPSAGDARRSSLRIRGVPGRPVPIACGNAGPGQRAEGAGAGRALSAAAKKFSTYC